MISKWFSLISVLVVFAFFLMGCESSDQRSASMDKDATMKTSSMKNGDAPLPSEPSPPQPSEAPMPVEGEESMEGAMAPSARRPSTAKRPSLADKGAAGNDPLAMESLDMDDSFSAIDRTLKNMKMANIAFNTPESMNLEKTELIHLILDMKKSVATLKNMIEGEGKKVGDRIRISSRMKARLTGQNFQIIAITPEIQAISGSYVTEWKWDIKPERTGSQKLHLTLSALIDVEGESTERAIETFDRVIDIQVTPGQTIKTFFKNNWQWLWMVVFAPIGTFLWRKKKGKGGEN